MVSLLLSVFLLNVIIHLVNTLGASALNELVSIPLSGLFTMFD